MASNNFQDLVKAQIDLGNKIFQALSKDKENIVFSPVLTHGALALVLCAVPSKLREKLGDLLQTNKPEQTVEKYSQILSSIRKLSNVDLINSIKIFVKNEVKTSFKKTVLEKFSAELDTVSLSDSKALTALNTSLTDGGKFNIQEDYTTNQFLLLNTLKLKSNWAYNFRIFEDAFLGQFSINESEECEVPMMSRTSNFKIKSSEGLEAQIVDIPFINGLLSMIVVLPQEKSGIDDLEKKLVHMNINEITEGLENMFSYVEIPKFKIRSTINMNNVLTKLGGLLNTEELDLSEMLEDAGMLVAKILHNVEMIVDEEGGSPPSPPRSPGGHPYCQIVRGHFRADHPFVFYVKTNEEVPLVIIQGRITNPLLS